MEYLPDTLSSYLDRNGTLPDDISYGILHDVALGLRYLHEHTPLIIHFDLTSDHILLTTSLSAKISDLNRAVILLPSGPTQAPSREPLFKSEPLPGYPCYLPPEGQMGNPNVTVKVDIFYFGVIVLHVLCGQLPIPDAQFQRDPANSGALLGVTEVNRRAQFLQQIGRDHPLSGLIRQCLSNVPDVRPEAADVLQQVSTAMATVLAPAETVIQQLEAVRQENQTLRREVQTKIGEIQTLTGENQALTRDVLGLRGEVQSLEAVNETISTDIAELSTSNQQLTYLNRWLESENSELRQCTKAQPSSGHSYYLEEGLQEHQISAPPVQPVVRPVQVDYHFSPTSIS